MIKGMIKKVEMKWVVTSVVPVTDFDVVIVSPISSHGNSDHMT